MMPPRPGTRYVAITAAAFFFGYLGWLLSGYSQGQTLMLADDVVLVVVSVPPLVFSFLAARTTRGRLRAAWSMMTVGLLAWNLGELVWTYYELSGADIRIPSPTDALFLSWPIAACAALLLFWNRAPQRSYSRILLDAIIVGGSLFLVAWLVSIQDLYRSGEAPTREFVIAMAYPVTDWIMVTVASIVLTYAQARLRLVLTLITLGLIAMAVNDTGYAYLSALLGYSSADILNAGWVAGLLLITVAAAYGRGMELNPDPAVEMPGWSSVWLPYAPLLLAAGMLAYEPADAAGTAPVRVIGALLFVTVLARQFVAVQENRRLLTRVSDLAQRDPLTGLPNRTVFADRLATALHRRGRTGRTVAVLSLDLDNFKLINDTLGHAAGDEMLTYASQRIAEAVLTDGTVARLGGDEFAVMIEGDPELPATVARRISDAFDTPISLYGLEMVMRPSIGRAVATPEQPDLTADDLLVQADIAMYTVKRSRSSAPGPLSATQPIQLLRQLRRAVDEGDLTLVYQPEFDLQSEALVAVEALLRWPHPDLGVMRPDEFLPLVRHHGLIDPMTNLVIDIALADARTWRAAGVTVPVAINIFPPSLVTIVGRIDHALNREGLEGSALTVEITEDFFVGDIDRIRRILCELRSRGVRVAIDDFGTGYSALQYLHDLPIDEVKLGHSLIAPVPGDTSAAAVVGAVIDLAHVLGFVTVAEGVETARTADWLRQRGCDFAQGHYLSPPLSAAGFLSLASSAESRSS